MNYDYSDYRDFIDDIPDSGGYFCCLNDDDLENFVRRGRMAGIPQYVPINSLTFTGSKKHPYRDRLIAEFCNRGYTVREICEVTGCTQPCVRAILDRLRGDANV